MIITTRVEKDVMYMNHNVNDVVWLLWKIKGCVEETKHRKERKAPTWGSSIKFIFAGSYDVLESQDDGPRYMKIMIDRINEARNLGLIVNESGEKEWKHNENWYLTAAGEEYFQKNKTWKD